MSEVTTNTEAKLRLIEAAANLPSVRAGTDFAMQAERTVAIARVWYTWIMRREASKRRGDNLKAPI